MMNSLFKFPSLQANPGPACNHFILLLFLFLLGACASLPENFEQQASVAWPYPEQTRLGAFVDQSPGSDGLPLDVGQDRKLEAEALREACIFFDGVDRDRDDLGSGGVDVCET